jgi:LPS-assembly lipoprotein
MLMNRRLFARTLLLSCAVLLAGCGFHLRGADGSSNIPFHKVYLGVAATSPLGLELKRYLRVSGDVTVVADAKDADASIEILTEARQKSVLTLNTQGRVREYSLFYRLNFQVKDKTGALLLPPTEIVLKRDISFNEAQIIAKEKEEEMMYRDMQSDLVQQILRRVAAIKPS